MTNNFLDNFVYSGVVCWVGDRGLYETMMSFLWNVKNNLFITAPGWWRVRSLLTNNSEPMVTLILYLSIYSWSAVAQLVECRTRNRESPGSNPRCYRFEVWAFSFTSRRLSRLSCINEYLAIDSGGNVCE